MKKKEIVVDVDELGNVEIEASNFQGNDCIKATQKLVDALGGEVTEFVKKDVSQQTSTQQQTRIKV